MTNPVRWRFCRACLLGSALAMAGAGAALAATGDTYRVTGQEVNLRAGPSDQSTVRSTVRHGDELLELRSDGQWLGVRVIRTGEEGWIYDDLVQRVAESGLGGPGAGVPDAGFRALSADFNSLVGRMDQQLGYPMVGKVSEGKDGTLQVSLSPEFLLYGGRDAHMAAALAMYEMWKNHQNGRPVSVAMLNDRDQAYITVRDDAAGPQIAVQDPHVATQ